MSAWETREQKAAYPPVFIRRAYKRPPDERKEGNADDYISGFLFILYVHRCPY